jgi:hypothetical protein
MVVSDADAASLRHARLSDFVAREAVRLNTPEMPDFGRSERATWPDGWGDGDAV